jgi:hypothetical protein
MGRLDPRQGRDGSRGDDAMFTTEELVRATVQERRADAERLTRLEGARRTRREKKRHLWSWHIEPDMEESFRYLLGWIIPAREVKGDAEPSSGSRAA